MSETNGTPNTVAEDNTATTTTDQPVDKDAELEKLRGTIGSLKREVKILKKGTNATDGDLKETPDSTEDKDDIRREIEELKLAQKGYSDEQITKIFELGGLKALDNPIVKAGLDSTFAKDEVKKKTQIFSSVSSSEGKKEVTADDIKNMSSKDMEKYLPKK